MTNPQEKVGTDYQYVVLGGQDCTRTSITGLQRHDYGVWSTGPFTGILVRRKGLLQRDGWLPATTRLGWRLQCICLDGDAVYPYKTSSRSWHGEVSSSWWHVLTDGLGSGPQRLALIVLKELETLGVLLSENSCLPCTAATMLRKAPRSIG